MTLDEYAFQNLIDENEELKNRNDTLEYRNESLEQENKELKEFKEKREESMFYFKALIERAEPKTAREAEDLQKAKMIFEKLYREKLGYLEQENTKLKEENKKFKADTEHTIKFNNKIIWKLKLENDKLKEENKWFKKKNKQAGKYVAATMKENKKLRDNYYNLSKIVEVSWWYKASYVNELRDKIAKLEFDIEAWKKWKKAIWL